MTAATTPTARSASGPDAAACAHGARRASRVSSDPMTSSGRVPIVGVHPTATDLSMPVLELARAAEARGLRSLYLPEHTHVPVDSMQITAEWRMAERYQRTLDP